MELSSILLHIQGKAVAGNARLVAVSKTQPASKIRALAAQGQKIFAENYVQEALPKVKELADLGLEWHFIGRLQKNKAKQVVGVFDLIHSVDSLELAEVINRIAEEKGLTQRVLLQLNLASEESKGGFSRVEFSEKVAALKDLKNLQIEGLMTMPPLFEDPERSRPYFQELRELEKKYAKDFPLLYELSMGTSGDFEIALEEGATLVRLGTLVFGERPAKNV
jgi:pyridoxal phosphate enzyme (YggS family)